MTKARSGEHWDEESEFVARAVMSCAYAAAALMRSEVGVADRVTPGASTNLLHIQATLRLSSGKPASGMCSTVSPNAMIGRGFALAGKSFHFASAAVGGDGAGRFPCPPGKAPQAATTNARTTAAADFGMLI